MMDLWCTRTEMADEYCEVVSVRCDDAIASLDSKNHEVRIHDICGT